MLILFPTHCTNVDLAALQQSTLHASSPSLFLVVHSVYILSSKGTKASVKAEIFYFPPYHQDLIWMQGNAIRD